MAIGTPMQIAATVVIAVVAFTIGILIGHMGIPRMPHKDEIEKLKIMDDLTSSRYMDGDEITKRIVEETKAENIRENSKFLSEEPHLAGSQRDNQLANHIQQLWLDQGLDRSELVPYSVLLSYPDPQNPNTIFIIDSKNKRHFASQTQEKPLRDADDNANFVPAYHGFSPNGDVTGDPVFVNYGRPEDFDRLEKDLNISVKGKICICRYGKIFRGNKVKNAADRGAIGVVLFSDPEDVARNGTSPESVYPNSWWMPGTAMQRGSILVSQGDPLTPGYPSVDGAYRYLEDDVDLPKIPSQPIGYEDAKKIFELMGGPVAPKEWKGGLNISYNIGPGFKKELAGSKMRLLVHNQNRRSIVKNVIGVIEGAIEPDRYVLVGNHRDSWGFGAMDAVTGTASLLEMTRVLGALKKDGWRPRRTLVFCSWAAEEFALTGSTEWVQENIHKIMGRAVATINIDTCVQGPIFMPEASPSLMDVVRAAAKHIPDPIDPDKYVYDTWKEYQQQEPQLETLGSGTDHASFAFYAGVPSINLLWYFDKKNIPMSNYPAYHTGYETFYLVDTHIDPNFPIHQSCARMAGVLSHILADSTFLPYNFNEMAQRMVKSLEELRKKGKLREIEKMNINLGRLETELANFTNSAHEWHEKLKEIGNKNPLIVRQINDQMMDLERVFIKPDGLPDRPDIRHVVFAPGKYDKYSKSAFPGILDLLYEIDRKESTWQAIERHLSDLMITIRMASSFLEPSSEL